MLQRCFSLLGTNKRTDTSTHLLVYYSASAQEDEKEILSLVFHCPRWSTLWTSFSLFPPTRVFLSIRAKELFFSPVCRTNAVPFLSTLLMSIALFLRFSPVQTHLPALVVGRVAQPVNTSLFQSPSLLNLRNILSSPFSF